MTREDIQASEIEVERTREKIDRMAPMYAVLALIAVSLLCIPALRSVAVASAWPRSCSRVRPFGAVRADPGRDPALCGEGDGCQRSGGGDARRQLRRLSSAPSTSDGW
jgi:hypothetical protein